MTSRTTISVASFFIRERCSYLTTESMILWIIPSIAFPLCQCHTSTMSCSGSTQMVFDPFPIAA